MFRKVDTSDVPFDLNPMLSYSQSKAIMDYERHWQGRMLTPLLNNSSRLQMRISTLKVIRRPGARVWANWGRRKERWRERGK